MWALTRWCAHIASELSVSTSECFQQPRVPSCPLKPGVKVPLPGHLPGWPRPCLRMDRRTGSGGQEAACRVSPRADRHGLARRAQPEWAPAQRGTRVLPGGAAAGWAGWACTHQQALPSPWAAQQRRRGVSCNCLREGKRRIWRAKMDSETSFCSSSFSQTNFRGRRRGYPASSQGPSPRLPASGGQRPAELCAPLGWQGPRQQGLSGSMRLFTSGKQHVCLAFLLPGLPGKAFLSQEQ